MNGESEPVPSSAPGGSSGVLTACAVLTSVSAAVWPLFALVGYARSGGIGILAAVIAAGVCWGGAVAGLAIAAIFRSDSQAVLYVLVGMAFRMALPLAACLIFALLGGPLVEAGILVMILLYYFITLIADTWLLLRLPRAAATVSRIS